MEKNPANVTNVASQAVQSVVGGAAAVGARRALAGCASNRACYLVRDLADRASLASFNAALARARSRASAFCFSFFCTKRRAAPTGGSYCGRYDTYCECVVAAGAGVPGGKNNSRGTGTNTRSASVMQVSVYMSDSVDDDVSPRGVGRLAGWGCDGNNLSDLLRCGLPSRRGRCV
jgi:hypothetical protein